MNVQFTVGKQNILLRSDAQNYELCQAKTRIDKNGNLVEGWEAFKFFQSLPQALNRLVDMKVRASDATTLKELAADLETVRQEIYLVWSTEINHK